MIKILVALAILAFVPGSTAASQERGIGSGGVIGKIQTVVDQAESAGHEVVRVEADLIRTEQVTFRQMQSGFKYGVVAVASNRIQDIDVEVHKQIDGIWVLIAKDEDASALAAVSFSPSVTGLYRVTTRVYRFRSGYDVGHYGLVVFHN